MKKSIIPIHKIPNHLKLIKKNIMRCIKNLSQTPKSFGERWEIELIG